MKNSIKTVCIISFIILILFSCSQEDPSKKFVKNYISEQENKIGIQCNDLYDNALQLLNIEISKFIQSCKTGEDGIKIFHDKLYKDINKLEKKLYTCWLCKSNADRVKLKMDGYYKELWYLFDILDHTFTQYGDRPSSIYNISPKTFLKIESYYYFFLNPSDNKLAALEKLEIHEPPVSINQNLIDIPNDKWVNKKFVFLERPISSQKYGYISFRLNQDKNLRNDLSELENEITRSLKYEKFVGKIILATNVQKIGNSFLITFEVEETKRKIYAETHKGKIQGIAYMNDLFEAKNRWNKKTIYSKVTSLSTYDQETDKFGTIKIEIGEPLKIFDITLGFFVHVRLWCKTKKGQIGFISTSYSWTNQYYDDWVEMRPWEYSFFEEKPIGDEWNEGNWNSIRKGEIKVGMTKEQVLINRPKPGRIIERNSSGNNEEIWLYISKELQFVDNILTSIRPRQ